MREIKFRAWDTERKAFHWGMSNLMLNLGGIKFWQFAYDAPEIVSQDIYILQQYTGLKDKNGKEIYEGDIVRDLTPYADLYETERLFENNKVIINLLVSWSQADARFVLLGDWNNEQAYYQYSDQLHDRKLEIIGNIYENPELLEASNV